MFLCLLFKHFHGQKNMEVHYINRTLEIRQKKNERGRHNPTTKGNKKIKSALELLHGKNLQCFGTSKLLC